MFVSLAMSFIENGLSKFSFSQMRELIPERNLRCGENQRDLVLDKEEELGFPAMGKRADHEIPLERPLSSQNFKSGKPFTSSTSVETLMLCHALASDSRFSSARRAYCTASLPSNRCAGSCSSEASCRIT